MAVSLALMHQMSCVGGERGGQDSYEYSYCTSTSSLPAPSTSEVQYEYGTRTYRLQ